eukprot:Skav205010  [mRNA]  locus=scaffold2134:84430:88357:- [translate_table: standard]
MQAGMSPQTATNLIDIAARAKASVDPVDSQQMTPRPRRPTPLRFRLHLCLVASEDGDLEVACGVRVHGLQSRAEWNGRLGSIIGPSAPATERSALRWPVLLEGNQEGVMLKAENLSDVDLETVDQLLEAGADVHLGNLNWSEGRTFLHEAVHLGKMDMAKSALRARADVNRQESSYSTLPGLGFFVAQNVAPEEVTPKE